MQLSVISSDCKHGNVPGQLSTLMHTHALLLQFQALKATCVGNVRPGAEKQLFIWVITPHYMVVCHLCMAVSFGDQAILRFQPRHN